MPVLQTETVTIDGNLYTIRMLDVVKGRAVLARLQRFLGLYAADAKTDDVGGAALIGLLAGALGGDDLEFLIQTFGPTTTVDVGGGRVLSLGGKDNTAAQTELFAGRYEALLEWIDACIKANFAGVIAKIDAGNARRAEPAKAQPTGE